MIKNEKEWPTSRLKCLSTESKNTVSSKIYYNSIESYVGPVGSFSKFSSLKKLNCDAKGLLLSQNGVLFSHV